MGIEVADLFATLGLKPDNAAWTRGDKLIQGIKHGLEVIAGFEMIKKVGEAVSSVIELGSSLNDTAQKTGISVEALQEYGYIAKQNSSSAEEFAQSVIKLSRGLDEATTKGTGPASDALARLGIRLNDPKFKNATLDDKITAIADALGKLPDGTQKTALAMDLFGRSGAQLIPTLNDIAENGAQLRQEFRNMGGELSGKDAAGLDKLGDTVDKAKAQLGALKNEVVVALAPALQDMVDGFLKWVQANKDLIASGIHAAVRGLMIAFNALGVAVDIVLSVFQFLEEHSEVTKAVLIALGIVLGVIAAEATVAWLAAMAPIIAVVAAITAAILILQDLWNGLTEGKGVFAAVFGWIADKFKAIGRGIKSVFGDIASFFESIASAVSRAFHSVIDWIEDKINWAVDKINWVVDKVGKVGKLVAHPFKETSNFIEGLMPTGQNGHATFGDMLLGVDGPDAKSEGIAAATYSPFAYLPSSLRSGAAAPVTNIDARQTTTINANGTDPQGVVDIAKEQIEQHHDRTWRNAAASLGVKDKP